MNYIYEGTFVNGMISGYGRFMWSCSSVAYTYYEGEFQNGLFEGQGKLYTYGEEKEGKFSLGSYVPNNLISEKTR